MAMILDLRPKLFPNGEVVSTPDQNTGRSGFDSRLGHITIFLTNVYNSNIDHNVGQFLYYFLPCSSSNLSTSVIALDLHRAL